MDELENEAQSIEALLLSRSYLYQLFGIVFSGEPDSDLIRILSNACTLDALDEFAEEAPEISRLKTYLASVSSFVDDEGAIGKAASEFTRALVGPGVLPALPWRAPYLSHELIMFQKDTLDVRQAYYEHGLRPSQLQRVPDDHLALECNFMGILGCELTASFECADVTAARELIVEQKSFLDRFMLDWTPLYAEGLKASGRTPFYFQFAAAVGALVRLDSTFLGEVLHWLKSNQANGAALEKSIAGAAELFPEMRRALIALQGLAPRFADEYKLIALS